MAEMMDGMSMDLENMNMEKLKAVFPESFAEGKLDIDKLLSLCGEYIDNDFEKYSFTWKGKAESLRLAQKRSTGTLRPCPEESVNWDTTQNLYIEGDNLEVLKLLQTAYFRKVKMIYIDPPYNTGNDFVYEDDFADPMSRYKEITQQTTKSNPETMGRFHTNWLNMMYPRLRLAANLLRDDGVIFISIDDNEVTNLRKICDEVFGEENFVAQINWKGRGGKQDSKYYATIHEYILCYTKNIDDFVAGEEIKSGDVYPKYDEEKGRFYKTQLLRKWGSNSRREDRPNLYYPITAPDGTEVYPIVVVKDNQNPSSFSRFDGRWRHGASTMQKNIENGLIEFIKQSDGSWIPYEKIYAPLEGEEKTKKYVTWIDDISNGTYEIKELFGTAVFDYAKATKLILKFLKMANVEAGDIVLDFFSGSATTAHAVMQLNKEDGGNRKFICVQLPEVCDENTEAYKAGYKTICEIGKERIRRAGKMLTETNTQMALSDTADKPLDIGFRVLKLDTSNLSTWDAAPIDDNAMELLFERMNSMIHRVKSDRTDMDMVFEIMLKLGVQPTAAVEKKDINGKSVYSVEDALILICLDKNIKPEDIEAMAEFAPGKIVISRDSFADDTAMSNAHYILKDREIELKLV